MDTIKINVIKPYIEIITPQVCLDEMMRVIEIAGRTCYKSEHRMHAASTDEFVSRIVKSGHGSVIEHGNITVRFVGDRIMSHQLVRHRLCSFCLAEDTKILRFKNTKSRPMLTVKELYERQNRANGMYLRSMLFRSMGQTGLVVPNTIKVIIDSGIKPVYLVKTSLGYKVRASLDHKFITASGEVVLKDLSIGSKVYVNGLELHKDKDWFKEKYENGLSPPQIAKLCGISRACAYDWMRRHKIEVDTRHKARTPWNRGLTEFDSPMIKNQADALRANHHNNGYGKENSSWKGNAIETDSGKRSRFSKYSKDQCVLCGHKKHLENHHKDSNVDHWQENNKMTLCASCHELIHWGCNIKKVIEDEIIEISYSGDVQTYDIEMDEPFHNFIADGFVVHNSQESQIYCDYAKKGFAAVCPPTIGNLEGTYQYYDSAWHKLPDTGNEPLDDTAFIWLNSMLNNYEDYLKLRSYGVIAGDARSVLPNATKTEVVVTCNLREWRHIFEERALNNAAQWQIKKLTADCLRVFVQIFPVVFGDQLERLDGKS